MASTRKPGRRFGLLAGAAAAFVAMSAAASAQQAQLVTISVQSQDLGDALNQLARQTNVQIVFRPELVRGRQAPALSGNLTAPQALDRMLDGTGLRYRSSGRNAYVILAQATDTRPTQTGAEQSASVQEDEIIVTAQKREERLQDVPVPVTALDASSLGEQNQARLQDFFSAVPNLSVTPANQSSQFLSIRGITTGGFTTPTVGIVVDGVPYTASTPLGGGSNVPDIDPGDLARIEVLRGPQGTLYGASSMGGLVNFITVDPSTDGLSGRLQAGVNTVHNGDDPGYSLRGSVNLPVSEDFAVRLSGFTRLDPGYIDNPVTGREGLNEQRANGGRAAALWRLADNASLRLSALYQSIEGDGANDILNRNGLDDLQQDYIPGTGAYERTAQAYSAIFNVDLGSAELSSISGYSINTISDSFDFSYILGGLNDSFFGVTGGPVLNDIESKKFSQEFRLTTSFGTNWDLLAGAFYTYEDSFFQQQVLAADAVTGEVVANALIHQNPQTYEESAVFADLTYHFSPSFDVQVGGRQSWITQTSQQIDRGPYTPFFTGGLPDPTTLPEVESEDEVFTYLVTPRLRVSPDLMIYARFASGYRAGGPNLSPVGVPAAFSPDTTQNYELGLKGDFFNRALTIDASLFFIDWRDIQVQLLNPATGLTYNDNAGAATSQGLEVSFDLRPWDGMTIGGWATLSEAELTETSAIGADGDPLPGSSDFSATLSLEQEFPLSASFDGFVGASANYVGDRPSVFTGSPARETYASYTRTDLRAGVRSSEWSALFYVNNIADERGVIGGGLGTFPPFGFYYIKPREIGVSITRQF